MPDPVEPPPDFFEPVHIEPLIEGLAYPTDHDGVVEHAKERGADVRALDVLERLPLGPFRGPNDITRAVKHLDEAA